MYRSIIRLKAGLSQEKIEEITAVAEQCFETAYGKSVNESTDPHVILHTHKNVFAITNGDLALYPLGFLDCIERWDFESEKNPRENVDTLIELAECMEKYGLEGFTSYV